MSAGMSEWMRVMLEEIARKQAEEHEMRAEEQRREQQRQERQQEPNAPAN